MVWLCSCTHYVHLNHAKDKSSAWFRSLPYNTWLNMSGIMSVAVSVIFSFLTFLGKSPQRAVCPFEPILINKRRMKIAYLHKFSNAIKHPFPEKCSHWNCVTQHVPHHSDFVINSWGSTNNKTMGLFVSDHLLGCCIM